MPSIVSQKFICECYRAISAKSCFTCTYKSPHVINSYFFLLVLHKCKVSLYRYHTLTIAIAFLKKKKSVHTYSVEKQQKNASKKLQKYLRQSKNQRYSYFTFYCKQILIILYIFHMIIILRMHTRGWYEWRGEYTRFFRSLFFFVCVFCFVTVSSDTVQEFALETWKNLLQGN